MAIWHKISLLTCKQGCRKRFFGAVFRVRSTPFECVPRSIYVCIGALKRHFFCKVLSIQLSTQLSTQLQKVHFSGAFKWCIPGQKNGAKTPQKRLKNGLKKAFLPHSKAIAERCTQTHAKTPHKSPAKPYTEPHTVQRTNTEKRTAEAQKKALREP